MAASLISVQVGQPRTYDTPPSFTRRKAPWRSGFVKEPVTGPVQLGLRNLAGDGQADLSAHGGRDKAVNVYPREHYAFWVQEGVLGEARNGTFGENFTVQGLLESQVCIGDRFQVGAAMVEVSQPRQPCWKLAHFVGRNDMVRRVISAGRTGWYFRVLEPGAVCADDRIVLQDRPFPRWTLDEANRLMHKDREDTEGLNALLACPALSQSWRESFERRLAAAK